MSFYLNRQYLYLSYYAHDEPLEMSAGVKVIPEDYRANKISRDQRAVIRRIETVISIYEVECRESGKTTKADEVRALVLHATNRKAAPLKRGRTFLAYFGQYLEGIESGSILKSGRRFSQSSINKANVIARMLPRTTLSKMLIDDIQNTDLQLFTQELTAMRLKKAGKAISKNTVSTYQSVVLAALSNGRTLGMHGGPLLQTKGYKVTIENLDHPVYLNADEQAAILALPLSGEEAKYRDTFIMGCQLGMRYSDLSRLTPTHRQGDLVNITTKKTAIPVWVPLNTIARELWDKYKGVFPLPPYHQLLPFIKKLGQDAGIDRPVLFSRTEGGVKAEKWVKKYELLGTHTCRRSFCTNAYKSGVDVLSIMKISGHKAMSSFIKYIRLSDEEHATMISAHPFFK